MGGGHGPVAPHGHGVSKFKLGHMWPNKKGYGFQNIFRVPSRGLQSLSAGKFEYLEIWIFLLCTKIRGPKSRIGFTYGLQLQNICSHGPNKKIEAICSKNDRARAIFVQSGGIFWFLRFLIYCSFQGLVRYKCTPEYAILIL